MAKVSIEVDTTKKEVTVKVDGKKIGSVSDIWINTEAGGFFSLEISQRENAGDDLRKVTRLTASVNDETWVEKDESISTEELTQALLGSKVT